MVEVLIFQEEELLKMPVPNPAEFYSPIIQAMIANAQDARQRQQNEVLAQQHKDEMALREKENDRFSKHLDTSEAQEQARIDSEEAVRTAARKHQLLLDKLDVAKNVQTGVVNAPTQAQQQQSSSSPIDPQGPQGSQGTPQNGPVNVAGIDFAPGELSSPQQAAQQEATKVQQTSGATVTGQQTAMQPFLDKDATRSRETERLKLVQEAANALTLQTQKGQDEKDTARIHGAYLLSNQRLEGANKLKEISTMHQLGAGDPVAAQSQVSGLIDAIDNGQRGYNTLSPDEKRGVDAMVAARGWVLPTDQKAHNKNLDTIVSMDTMLDQYRDLINKYSRDSPSSNNDWQTSLTQKLADKTSGMIAPVIPGGDMAAALNGVKSTAGKLMTTFEDLKRGSDSNIIRQVIGTFDPHATMQQNMTNTNQKQGLLNGITQRTFAGMPPEQVNKILGDNHIKNFGGMQPPPAELNFVRDPKTNQLVPAPAAQAVQQ